MDTEVTTADIEPTETLGGPGGESKRPRGDRGESGLTETHEQRLTGLAIRRGWITGKRWPTDATEDEIINGRKPKDLSIREATAVSVAKGLRSRDLRVAGIAVRNSLTMEQQNQADDHSENGSALPAQVNVNVGVVADGPVKIYLPDNGRE